MRHFFALFMVFIEESAKMWLIRVPPPLSYLRVSCPLGLSSWQWHDCSLEVLLDVLEVLLEVLDLSLRSWRWFWGTMY